MALDTRADGLMAWPPRAAPHPTRPPFLAAAAHLGGTSYGNSKLAVAGLTITFARELGKDGVRGNAISLGLIITDTIRAELPEATKTRIAAMQMIGEAGAEQAVVDAMLYLTSSSARFVTGEILRVTGGMAAGI